MSTYSNNARIELTGRSLSLEERLKPITTELNSFPLRVNKAAWAEEMATAEHIAEDLVEFCRYLAKWEEFRPNSPADCRTALGITQTDKDSLLGLVNQGSVLAESVLDARSAIAYQSQLRKWRSIAEFGFVQPFWNSLGTPHGRYTSERPCLNNRIRPIRRTIEPDPDYSFLSMDLSQAEYVCWASLSGDLALCELFLSDRDFHQEMASMVLELVPTWDLRGQELRQCGKTLNFSILYLMQPYTLSVKLGCDLVTARKIIKVYYKRAKTGIRYIHRVLDDAREVGFVETYFGRRRYAFDYQNGCSERERHEIAKTLWAHHNSGSTAELVKFKQCEIWETLRKEGFTTEHVRLSIQMFDQLIWSVRNDLLGEIEPIISELWNRRVPGFLLFKSKIKHGGNWASL